MESISQEQVQIQMTENDECLENTLIDLLDKSPLKNAGNLFRSNTWQETKARIPLMLGEDMSNNPRVLDLDTAPHILIGGTTGSGKSVCERLFILSMLLRFSPAELRLILVDPKMVEFSDCQALPHLLAPVITDVSKAVPMLNWAVGEKNRRYALLKEAGVRDIMEYNSRQVSSEPQTDSEGAPLPEKLPYIVILIDEFADLMLSDRTGCKNAISRLANSRAVGIHTIISTQRFDRKVLPGSIRGNYPMRIGFKLLSLVDSKFLLGCNGAEMLL